MPAQPDPWPSLKKRIVALEDAVRRRGSAFFGTGLHPNGQGGLDSDNYDAAHGFSLKGETGDAEFNGSVDVGGELNVTGNTVIGGTLSLPAGIIDNEDLANPVVPQSVWKGTTANFGLAVAWSTLVSQTLTVPSGVDSVQVIGFVRLVATNTTATKDYLYSDFDIAGQSSGGFATPVDAGDPGTSFCSFARTITGLTPGDTITLSASGSTGFASWASTNNVCQISASVTWYR